MFPPVGAVPWNVTLCRASENCQVTEPPAGIVTSDGVKDAFGVITTVVGPLGGGAGGGGAVGGGEPADETTIVPRIPLSRCLKHS